MKFRKKPIEVDAIQYNGENSEEIIEFATRFSSKRHIEEMTDAKGNYLMVKTLQGYMAAPINDWIIKGVKGEFYPCKPDIFGQTYESVEG